MPETTETAPVEPQEGQQEQPKPQTLEEMLSDLDDDRRNAVLGEVTKARTEAKNLRTRLKAAEPKIAEYEAFAAASKTDAERQQEAILAANARAEAAAQRVVTAEIRAALTGVVDDPNSVIEDLNLTRFVDDDGDVDQAAVAALRNKYAGFRATATGPRQPRPDMSQGAGANGKASTGPAQEFASVIQAQLGRR